MHLLYIDDSGSIEDPSQEYFVLAGLSVFERQTHWIEQKLNEIATRFNPANPHEIELHGSPMRSGREGWKRFNLQDRLTAIDDSLIEGVSKNYSTGVRVFGSVIKKKAMSGHDPIERAFEQISSRFDRSISTANLHKKRRPSERGYFVRQIRN